MIGENFNFICHILFMMMVLTHTKAPYIVHKLQNKFLILNSKLLTLKIHLYKTFFLSSAEKLLLAFILSLITKVLKMGIRLILNLFPSFESTEGILNFPKTLQRISAA